jgi:hypothetical protein
MVRRRTSLLVASVLLVGMLGIGGMAAATPAATSIGPHQHFVGLVNETSTKATVIVACPGPVRRGQMGHPVGGTIAVEPPSTIAGTSGYTGSHGRSVVATFVVPVPVTTTSAVTFTRYGSQAIPSTLLLPCSGSGTVVFAPAPTSKTAQSASVGVTFENIAVDPHTPASTVVTASRTILVTQADSGHTYRLHKGDGLDVQLSSPSNFIWTEPASSNQTVLQRTGGSSGTTATGTFVARSRGKAQVTAIGTPNCSGACPTVILAFEVNVTVVG